MVGKTISQYKILERVGGGGMGVVYKAEDLELGRPVAIKILPPELAEDEAAKERFKQEARTASALDHPNICTIYQAGETDEGQLFLAMAYYEGETLKQRIARGKLPTGEAIEITAQLAHGLARAHDAGIYHRDIKPANVIITRHGETKILDFGLAKLAEGARLTKDGTTVGTPAYMSPEQIRGEEIDGRADIWSLGVVLFEMLTGELPFKGGADSAVIYSILNEEQRDIGELRPDLPEPLRSLVGRALAKDHETRLQTAADVLEALRPLRAETPTEAFLTPEEPTRAMPTPVEPRKRPTLWIAGAAVVLLVALLIWLSSGWLGGGAEETSDVPLGAAVSARGEVVTILPFTFRGNPNFAYLGDGIVDLLATKLDGAGDLRTSDPQAVLSLVEREDIRGGDPEAARRVASQFGATYFVTGEILEAGGNLHVSASLYEPGRAEATSTYTAEGSSEVLFGLVDEIAGALLAEQIQAPSVKVFSTAAMTTDSLPALRTYLKAESELRRGEFTQALESYQRTVELDPEFALAWYRLSVAAEWSAQNNLVGPAVAKALEFQDRLSEHDRGLLEARLANRGGDPERAEEIYRSILGRYPDDVEAWVQMSEILSHYNYMTGRSMTESREALEKVIHYEPGYVGAWWHLARVAAVEGKAEEVDAIVQHILDMNPEGERALEMEILRAVAMGDDDSLTTLVGELDAIEDHVVSLTAWGLAMTQVDPSGAIEVLDVLTHPDRSDEAKALGHEASAWLQLSAGRLDSAIEHLHRAGEILPPRRLESEPIIRLLPWVPFDEEGLRELRAELVAWDAAGQPPSSNPTNFFSQHDQIHALLRAYLIEMLDARLGESDAGPSEQIAEAESSLEEGITRSLSQFLQNSLRGYRAYLDGDMPAVLMAQEDASFGWAYQDAYASPFYGATFDRWLHAEALRETGRLDEAMTWYSTFGEISFHDEAFVGPASFRRAQIHDQRGEAELAIRYYRQLIELWSDADPALRSWVDDARARLEELETS